MVALSTRFARWGRAADGAVPAPTDACDAAERAGASGLVLDRALPPDFWEPLVRALERRGESLPVVAVEAPCPAVRGAAAMLSSSDREEARTALELAVETVRRAGELGARFVAVWLGEARALDGDWRHARERFLRGELDERLARRLVQRRRAESEQPLDVALRALDRLARAAEGEGVTLAVANARRYTALPDAREWDLIARELRGAPLAPLFDVPAAHLPDAMGLQPFALTQAAFGQAPLVYLGDACGPLGALPPGRGELDLAAVAAQLAPDAAVAFSPWSGLTVEESLAAVPAVAALAAARPSPVSRTST